MLIFIIYYNNFSLYHNIPYHKYVQYKPEYFNFKLCQLVLGIQIRVGPVAITTVYVIELVFISSYYYQQH